MIWQFDEFGYGSASNGDCTSSDPGRTIPKPIRWDYDDPARCASYEAWDALIRLSARTARCLRCGRRRGPHGA